MGSLLRRADAMVPVIYWLMLIVDRKRVKIVGTLVYSLADSVKFFFLVRGAALGV